MTTTNKTSNLVAKVIVGILIAALVILSAYLVQQYRISAKRGVISAQRSHLTDLIRRHSLGFGDVGLIAPWMTFDYISVSFKVPASYLMTSLDIASSTRGYPKITLARYARSIPTTSDAITTSVRNAVEQYLASSTIPNAIPAEAPAIK